MLKKLALALRYHLRLDAIERDIGYIKGALEDQELRAGAALANNQQHLVGQIEDQGLRTCALLANNQQQLESIIRELGAGIVTERSRRDTIELKLAGSIAELTNEVRRLSDVVDEQRRSTTFKQHDNDQ